MTVSQKRSVQVLVILFLLFMAGFLAYSMSGNKGAQKLSLTDPSTTGANADTAGTIEDTGLLSEEQCSTLCGGSPTGDFYTYCQSLCSTGNEKGGYWGVGGNNLDPGTEAKDRKDNDDDDDNDHNKKKKVTVIPSTDTSGYCDVEPYSTHTTYNTQEETVTQ